MNASGMVNMPRLVAAIGMFDGVHLGHRQVIGQVRGIAERLGMEATVFTFARHPMLEVCPDRAPMAISTMAQRADMLVQAGAESVHFLNFDASLRRLTAYEFMARLHHRYGVEVIVMGYNHRFGSDKLTEYEAYRRIGESVGIEVVRACEHVADCFDGHLCSSEIRAALTRGQITLANLMLGRAFSITGTVSHGLNIGHTIGFPTANVRPMLTDQLIPLSGAYAAYAKTRYAKYPAMVNVGINPTVGVDSNIKIEAHLIGYEGNLYGQIIEIGFLGYIRGERRFGSLESLKAQLEEDKATAISVYDSEYIGG